MVDFSSMFISILVFLVIVALCIFVYNLLIAPMLGRPATVMPIMDLIVLLLFIGIVLFALQASGLWDKLIVVHH